MKQTNSSLNNLKKHSAAAAALSSGNIMLQSLHDCILHIPSNNSSHRKKDDKYRRRHSDKKCMRQCVCCGRCEFFHKEATAANAHISSGKEESSKPENKFLLKKESLRANKNRGERRTVHMIRRRRVKEKQERGPTRRRRVAKEAASQIRKSTTSGLCLKRHIE
jgi:hypothetical protein